MEGDGNKYLLRGESYLSKVDEEGVETCRMLMKACVVGAFSTMDDALDEIFSQLACDQTMTFYAGGDKEIPKGRHEAESVFYTCGEPRIDGFRYVFRYVAQEVPADAADLAVSKQMKQFFK